MPDGSPEWDQKQRDWMRALEEYRESLCPVCGNPREYCQAAEHDGRFTVPPPTRCHATTAIRRAQENTEYQVPEALIWSAEINE